MSAFWLDVKSYFVGFFLDWLLDRSVFPKHIAFVFKGKWLGMHQRVQGDVRDTSPV